MTIKEYFLKEFLIREKQRKNGMNLILFSMLIFFIVFVVFAISALLDNKSLEHTGKVIQLICILVFCYGSVKYIKSILSLKKVILCPNCKKSLSYLVTDDNYSNKTIIFGIPQNLPENVDSCPFCKISFTTNILSVFDKAAA